MIPRQQRGSLMITAIVMIVTLALLSAVATRLFISQTLSSSDHNLSQRALLLAESGLEKGKRELTLDTGYLGEANTAFDTGTFTITILDTEFDDLTLLSTGQYRIKSIGQLATSSGTIQRTVEEIISLSGESGWAVGNGGTTLRWSGSTWSAKINPYTFDIHDVTCNATDDCWFVGSGGEIGHWNGLTLEDTTTYPSGTTTDLNAVACAPNNADQCFAVGNSGTIRAWNGTSWGTITSTTTTDLNGIHCPDDKCYAVGNGGEIIAYTGSWADNNSGVSLDLYDIHCWPTDGCWAVGEKNGQRFYLVYRDGGNWTNESWKNPSQRRSLNGVACLDNRDTCWTMGVVGKTLRNDTSTAAWTLDSSGTTATINDIWCSQSTTECWATGLSKAGNNTLLQWLGTSWLNTTSTAPATALNAIHFAPGAAAGGGATLATLSWRELIL